MKEDSTSSWWSNPWDGTVHLLTRVFAGPGTFRGQDAVTGISVFNPSNEAVTVELTYLFPAPAGSTQALLEAVLEIPVRSLFAGQPSEIFGAPVSGGVITGEVNLDPVRIPGQTGH